MAESNADGFRHEPVMVDEVVEALVVSPPGVILDATAGGGGHSAALLERSEVHDVVGLDQDLDAVEAAGRRLAPFGARARVVHARFDRLDAVLDELGVDRISGALFDLGVSSPQFDRPERGFSYRTDAPLDMRMDRTRALTASHFVNEVDEAELRTVLQRYGDEPFAARIARAVVRRRPIAGTAELADTVRDAIPAAARRRGGHPATRTFQALRIAVNDELAVLPASLDAAVDRCAIGGRVAVLAYHSGEDRLVKECFRHAETGGCVCPPKLDCVCGAVPRGRLVRRGARKPAAAEIERNPRAASARLRVLERR